MIQTVERRIRLAAVLLAINSSAALAVSLPALLREMHRTMSTLESYAFEFDVQLLLEGTRDSGTQIRGTVYKHGPRFRKDFEGTTYLYAPGMMLVINLKEKTISCSQITDNPQVESAMPMGDVATWFADDAAIEDLGKTPDGQGFAFRGRSLGIVRTELYVDARRKLPTKIIYHYGPNQTGGPTSAVVRYRWMDAKKIALSLLDPATYVITSDGRCRATAAYQDYRFIDEPRIPK